jgi:hypothetical protein
MNVKSGAVAVLAALIVAVAGAYYGLMPRPQAVVSEQVAPLDGPSGEVVLNVSGKIAVTNGDGVARLDLGMLKAMGETSFKTTTLWTEGEHTFTGVSLAALMKRLGVSGGTIKATAINDYAVDIPVSDAVDNGPIVAYSMDGADMSIRDKGPLWIVYPYDSREEYQTEVIYSRSIWQLDRILIAD